MTTHTTIINDEWREYVQTVDAMKALEALRQTAAAMTADEHPLAALIAAGRWEALDRLLNDLEAA